MKSLSTIFAIAIMFLIAYPVMAGEVLTVAYDQQNQRMHMIFVSTDADGNPVPVTVLVSDEHGGCNCTGVQYYDENTQSWENGNYFENQSKVWCTTELHPGDQPVGTPVTFSATVQVLNPDFSVNHEVVSGDNLVVIDGSSRTGETELAYAQGCSGLSLPSIIDIGQSYCATICHGSYSIPIFCEDPGYTPELMQITIENGCDLNTECNSPVPCTGLEQYDNNFQSQVFVFPGCYLLLQLSYCGFDEGCICISRGDFFLPVEMGDIDMVAGDNEVAINWTTASEHDNDRFEIERDGQVVASIPSTNRTSGDTYHWMDHDVVNGTQYNYELFSVDLEGNRVSRKAEAVTPSEAVIPAGYSLAQNYPNPFNSETVFSFTIPTAQHVRLTITDILGRQVATIVDGQMAAGSYTRNWNAGNIAAGVYMYTLTAGDFTQTHKLLYLK